MALWDIVPFGKKSVPVRREEESPFTVLKRGMDDLFEQFMSGFEIEPFESRVTGVFSPRIDVTEDDKAVKVMAELPGMDEKDLDISLRGNTLTIKGEKKEEKEQKGRDYYRMERSYGSFSRTIPLSSEFETDKVQAELKKGVLTVTLPKTVKAIEETKKIPVKEE
jgi:HSP20 family protein